jgi:hypothetical protein
MLISRRAVVARGFAALAGLYGANSAQAATRGVSHRLKAGPHCNCRACHHHAANKLFATRAAAEHGRAHPGCKCTIVRTSAVNTAQWQALFGHAHKPRHLSVDRRWASTKRALRQAARAPKRPAHAKSSRLHHH